VFAHTCDIFFERGIARLETLEVSSLSVEEAPGHELIVTLFEVEATKESVQVGGGPSGLLEFPSARSQALHSRTSVLVCRKHALCPMQACRLPGGGRGGFMCTLGGSRLGPARKRATLP
jgi:hypothetical protein